MKSKKQKFVQVRSLPAIAAHFRKGGPMKSYLKGYDRASEKRKERVEINA